jgi:hypothetical protein
MAKGKNPSSILEAIIHDHNPGCLPLYISGMGFHRHHALLYEYDGLIR